MPANHKWSLQEAIQIIREIQPELREIGFHVCLGGGVLNKGISDNDLDLYFMPLEEDESEDDKPGEPSILMEYLQKRFGQLSYNDGYEGAETCYRRKVSTMIAPDNKHKRIDMFVV